MYNRKAPVEERFLHYVEKTETCWLWLGAKSRGYGHITINNRSVKVHRYSYKLHVGPIPDGLTIDHLCRVKHCVNPEHFELVTALENVRRRVEKNPQPKQKDCLVCGSTFVPPVSKRKRQKACSARCANELKSRSAKARWKAKKEAA